MKRVLAISPHLDDAILSVGASLAALVLNGAHVEIQTVFAGVPRQPLSRIARAFHEECGLRDDAILARREEDTAAAATIGAHPGHLDFLEALYRRRADGAWLCDYDDDIFDPGLPEEPALVQIIATAIGDLCVKTGAEQLMTCVGVGGHVDHRLTRDATLIAAADADLPVVHWEDLPYGISRPLPEVPGEPVLELPPAEAWARKERAIACYRSQMPVLWQRGPDWRRQLDGHARLRGQGCPAELMWKVHPARSNRPLRSGLASVFNRRAPAVEHGPTPYFKAVRK